MNAEPTDNASWHADLCEQVNTPFMVDYGSPQAAADALEEALRPLADVLAVLLESRRV